MSIQIAVVDFTGPTDSVNLGAVLTGSGEAEIVLTLLTDSDPASAPVDVATVHLSADAENTVGYFLTPDAPRLNVYCDPAALWVSVQGEDEFVQVLAVR